MDDRPSILRELRICRFCLTEKEPLSNIYVKDKNNAIPLPLQIMACVALEVFANDGMPQLICDNCRTQTRKSYNFKTICKRSDDALKLYLATGVLKRGDSEIETNKNNKRTVKTENVQVVTKRRKTTDESKKISTVPAVNLKEELNNTTTTSNEENIVDQKEQISEENHQNDIKEPILTELQPVATKQDDESQINAEEVNPSDVMTEQTAEQPQIISKIEPNEVINSAQIQIQPEMSENQEEFDQAEALTFNNMQIVADTTIERYEMDFEAVYMHDEAISVLPKVPQIATQCFPCPSCERSFPLQQLLDIHMRQHTRERKFNCNECDKKFFSKHDLAKHSLIHTGSKPFSCVICDKSFSRATLLHRHEKIHISVPKYLCTYCDKTYLASEDLDAHMRTHKKNRPFQCSQCDKRFAFKQGLERHESTHTTDNPHKCNYCEESFSTSSKLQRHITCHAGARPYPCKLCPRTFLLSHHLTRHLRNHYSRKSKGDENGEHKCDVCSMSFKRRYSLVNHSAIHSMVNLKCVICNKEFEDAETVKQHITTHLSGLPFFCFKCEYSFENEEDLLEHEQKHSGEPDYESDSREDYNVEEIENTSHEVKPDNPEEITSRRRSQRGRKVKNYADFLKDEDFSESEENVEESDEEYTTTPVKANTSTIQPVIRSETMKVYKGVKDKGVQKVLEVAQPIPSPTLAAKTQDITQKISDSVAKEPKTLTKITTLETLGLSKSTLDAITDKSGFVEMKIGQKVIRVQKLMMTKADVQAMAEQGKIEMKGTKVVVKNSCGGILDFNKLTNLGKGNAVEDLTKETNLPVSNIRGVRTYVKKSTKRDDPVIDITENESAVKEIQMAESIDIDVKANSTEEVTTSIEETKMINFG